MARQTASYLRNLFARRGIAPRHRHGQNFLIDLNLHDVIVQEAALTADDVVLEVGPGAGALTSRMAREAAAVVAVEIDPAMAALTEEATAEFPNVRVLNRDVLASKHRIDPVVLDNLRAGLAVAPGSRRLKLVANLPYHIATPLLVDLLVGGEPALVPSRMVITIQKEVADRLVATPGSESYGSLAAIVQALGDAELLRVLPPSVFWPRPKVESAVVRIEANPAKRAAIPDVSWYQDVVRKLFSLRRKHLRGALTAHWRDRLDAEAIDAMLAALDLSGQLRAEALTVPELIDLAEALRRHAGPLPPGSAGPAGPLPADSDNASSKSP
ncbi:MAG: 16S rRNA (adenine(1518)-N(6)/adenine(1519)-N(6))-dimethyltransferase RsmA [Isosphaeraceae bacterium]